MALAYLCNQLEKSKLVDELSVTAFVVDHKAREESSREAAIVASWLSQMGMYASGPHKKNRANRTGLTTKILELEWPGSEAAKPTAFETVARRLRFQALGTACRDMHVETLLMGHHQDDNVETTIWRLCTGARGAGLAGIAAVANLPECHGLYGVSGSGSFFTLSSLGYRVSTGSIKVCRPLLGLPKKYLLETCHEHSVPFVEDPTNFDPTLTPRNAIRSLRSENRLPRALGAESILSLIRKSRALVDTSVRLSDEVLARCNVLRLDLAAGWMVIRFPPQGQGAAISSHQVLTVALRRITEFISPFPDAHFPLKGFEGFTERMFPRSSIADSRQSFTLGGIMFQPSSEPTGENPDNGNTTWLLTRQPFMRHRLPNTDFSVPVSPVEHRGYTQWTLWDNRYWIRIGAHHHHYHQQKQQQQRQQRANTSHIPIKLRPLHPKDIQRLRAHFPKSKPEHPVWSNLSERLSRDAPGSARFSLPVLVTTGDAVGIDMDEVLLALPTLGIKLPVSERWPWDIYWEWMFKEIDRATLTSMGFSIVEEK